MTTDTRPGREWPIPPMDKEAGYKDTAFTWAMGELILARIADGETMKAITADARMPAYCTVYQWMRVVPAFETAVAELRATMAQTRLAERQAHRLARRQALRRRPRGPSRRGAGSAAALERFLARLRAGASVSEAVVEPGAPSLKMIYARLRGCPGFRAAFADACDWRNSWLGFQAHLVVDEVAELGIRSANAKIARLKGRRGRLTPKTYREPARRFPNGLDF